MRKTHCNGVSSQWGSFTGVGSTRRSKLAGAQRVTEQLSEAQANCQPQELIFKCVDFFFRTKNIMTSKKMHMGICNTVYLKSMGERSRNECISKIKLGPCTIA